MFIEKNNLIAEMAIGGGVHKEADKWKKPLSLLSIRRYFLCHLVLLAGVGGNFIGSFLHPTAGG